MTLRRHAAQQGWTLGKITVGVRWAPGNAGKAHIERRVSFAKPLTATQKQELLKVAENSEVSQVLRAGIPLQSSVVD